MTDKSKVIITTPIYYINDKPHIGHTYCTVAADILARWYRMHGKQVLFTTGVDENASKTVEAAQKAGKEVKVYTDEMAHIWETTWDNLGISHDMFIRTTRSEHRQAVYAFWKAVETKGDISKGTYEGWYCTGCEAYVKESDLVEGLCPNHKSKPIRLSEENYFFNLPYYRDRLLGHMDQHPSFVAPPPRFHEVRNYIAEHLDPLSISRRGLDWGIPVPSDDTQTIYVWFDALLNYITAVGYGRDNEMFGSWWNDDTYILHLVGKDIIKFHCAIWPAMLMSAGVHLPDQIFAHGFFTIDGDKISKSLGNVIDPLDLEKLYGFDAVRYFLFREIQFGDDGDFSQERLHIRYKNDLANDLGNLLNRVLVMTEKYCEGKVPEATSDPVIEKLGEKTWKVLEDSIPVCRFSQGLDAIWQLVRELNQLVDREKPWELVKTNEERLRIVLYTLLAALRQVSWMIAPYMPSAARRMAEQLGAREPILSEALGEDALEGERRWGGLRAGEVVKRGKPLFPVIT
jgi:methionyl-tRNA synthetase